MTSDGSECAYDRGHQRILDTLDGKDQLKFNKMHDKWWSDAHVNYAAVATKDAPVNQSFAV